MYFVNSIAQVVHSEIDKYLVVANKNIGDSYLLVWRAPNICTQNYDDELITYKNKISQNLTCMALFFIIKVILKLKTRK